MPDRRLHVEITDDGETVELRYAIVTRVGDTHIPVLARQNSMLSLPEPVLEEWARRMVEALREEL